MPLRLLLIRHAKSSWAEPGLADFDRPLNARGERGATAIGRWLRAQGIVIDGALVSPARRTRETWDRIAAEIEPVPARFVPEFYESDAATMRAVLGAAPEASALAVVGHNPSTADFARRLLAAPPDDAEFAKYPTAATSVIDFDAARWAEVGWGTGRLAAFVTPKRLEG